MKAPEDCGSTFKWPNYWLLVSYRIGFDVRLLIVPQVDANGFNTQNAPILVFNRMDMTSSSVKDALQARKQCGPFTPHNKADMLYILSTLGTPLPAVFLSPSSAPPQGCVRLHGEGMLGIRLLLSAACRKSNPQKHRSLDSETPSL